MGIGSAVGRSLADIAMQEAMFETKEERTHSKGGVLSSRDHIGYITGDRDNGSKDTEHKQTETNTSELNTNNSVELQVMGVDGNDSDGIEGRLWQQSDTRGGSSTR